MTKRSARVPLTLENQIRRIYIKRAISLANSAKSAALYSISCAAQIIAILVEYLAVPNTETPIQTSKDEKEIN